MVIGRRAIKFAQFEGLLRETTGENGKLNILRVARSALKTASCARSRRMGYNYMQIGQLVVPDIFAVLVNFTLAAQQIAKITTLYTSPSVLV